MIVDNLLWGSKLLTSRNNQTPLTLALRDFNHSPVSIPQLLFDPKSATAWGTR